MTEITDRMRFFIKYLERAKLDFKQYQYDGVQWIIQNELRTDPPCGIRGGFIADEMGLGKTIMMIGTMLCNYQPGTLIIVPPVLIDQWYIQIYKTTGHKSLIYHGENKKTISVEQLSKANIVITTYGAITLTKKQIDGDVTTPLHKIKWARMIFDEAHHLRNKRTTRYISAKMLKANICWLVSGTPVQNKKDDFYSLCSMIRLPASYYTDSANLKELALSFILKRTKKQVGIQMTEVVTDKNIVHWTNDKEMQLSEEIHSALAFSHVSAEKGKKIAQTLAGNGPLPLLLYARQSCILPKMMAKRLDKLNDTGLISNYAGVFDHSSKLDSVVASILERKGNGCGKLIFCHFREEIDEIATRLVAGGITTVATFDGRTSNGKRSEILNAASEALILQIQTGCEGLNLQENYSEIYFVSPHWNPAIEDQAIARCHRIGQTKPVFVKRFEMENFADEEQEIDTLTVDNYVEFVQERKRIVANECI
ncbi:DEAD/DEAH box helicase [bacterium]|nr:DEAD/DEAH box helicase [bacterium]